MALPIVGWAAMYEEANRSIFGPVAFNCAAPDDGNMNLLALVGTPAQKEQMAAADRRRQGAVRLRHDGAGARRRLRSRHDPDAGRADGRSLGDPRPQVVHHRRRRSPTHFILIARTSDDARRGLTAFLFHRDQPGWRIVRRIPIMGPEEHGGHCELVLRRARSRRTRTC